MSDGLTSLRSTRAHEGQSAGSVIRERWNQKQAIQQSRQQLFLPWALRVPEQKTGPLDFKRFPFQIELYEEGANTQEIVVAKSTQVGISTWLLRWAMYHADVSGLTALYVFPKSKHMQDFSDARIKPVILASDYLKRRIPSGYVSNKGLKRIGFGWLYLRGSESSDDLQSIDADVLALDEYDDLTEKNIPDAERRTSGSQYGYWRRVGVPTTPGWGIDKLYAESDRRRWTVKCPKCGEWQHIVFAENVDLKAEKPIIVCRNEGCRKGEKGKGGRTPLDVRQGEWVAEYPDREKRGYHVSRLIAPTTNLELIVKNSEKTSPSEREAFHNKDLGEAWAPAEGRLTQEHINAAARDEIQIDPAGEMGYDGDNVVTMGVDVASVRDLNVRISEHTGDHNNPSKRTLWVGPVSSFGKLTKLMRAYKVNMAAIDHEPDGRLARRFAESFPGRVYLIAQSGTIKQAVKVEDDLRIATFRRVDLIDATFESIRQQRNLLPAARPEDYDKHLKALIRATEEDEEGKVKTTYRKTAADDYAQAEMYDLAATEMFWYQAGVDEATEEKHEHLEDYVDFERAELEGGTSSMEYGAGGDPDEYDPGFE